MTESNEQLNKSTNKETKPALSADDALLDSFFSLVASIAVRLTKDGTTRHNTAKESGTEKKP